MRRLSMLLVGVAVAASLLTAACGGGDDDETTPAPTEDGTATATEPSGGEDLVALGEQVANQNGCLACHTTSGAASVGPTWQGLAGSERTLEDGSTVTADEDYLRQSILDPNSQVVEGFAAIMPTNFATVLSDDQVDALVAYIQSLE